MSDQSACCHGSLSLTADQDASLTGAGDVRPVNVELYHVVAEYSARHDGELSMFPGDVISLVRVLGNGWSLGRNDTVSASMPGGTSVAGIFPSRCIVPAKPLPPPPRLTPTRPERETPLPPLRECQQDGVSSSRRCEATSHPQCPECSRSTATGAPVMMFSGASTIAVHRPPMTDTEPRSHAVAAAGDFRSLPSPPTNCNLCGYKETRQQTATDNATTANGRRCCDVINSLPPPPGPGSSCAVDCGHSSRRRAAAECSDWSANNDQFQPEAANGPPANSTPSSQPVTPRRQITQQPLKPHLIVKPTRDPTGSTDSPPISGPDDRQADQCSRRQPIQHHHHHQRRPDKYNDDDNNEENCVRCHVDHDDVDDVQPAWCGWRSIGRDRRRAGAAASGNQCPGRQQTSARDSDSNRLSTFIGPSSAISVDNLEQVTSPSTRHPFIGSDADDNAAAELSLRRGHVTNRRCKHHHRYKHNHDSTDPPIVFPAINASRSFPDLSFGLSPASNTTSGTFHGPMSSGGKTVLNSRTPRVVGDSASGRSGSLSRHRRRSKFASCWCRLVGSAGVGLASGALTFSIMIYDIGYGLLPATICAAIVVVLMTAFLLASRLCRCVVGLVPMSLSTACGRAALCLVVSHILFGGPVYNITGNAGEAVRALTCSTQLALNRTAGLMRPFDAMMRELDRTVARLEGAANDVSRGLRPLDEGLDAVEMDVNNARIQLHGTRRVSFVICQLVRHAAGKKTSYTIVNRH